MSGLLVKERDHAAVTAAMLRLVREPALYTSMGAAASQWVREKFDLNKQTRLLEELYAEVAIPDRHWGKPPPPAQARIV
jgi:glycosyltransferase involved in cell wall biosynthesis